MKAFSHRSWLAMILSLILVALVLAAFLVVRGGREEGHPWAPGPSSPTSPTSLALGGTA